MTEDRIIELEIRLAYQDDLLQTLNNAVAEQQKQIGKLEETCKLLHEKIKNCVVMEPGNLPIDEKPPHY